MTSTLFRTEVIEARRERLTGTVIAASPPGARIYGAMLAIAFALSVAVLLFGSFATRESVKGLVAPDLGIARVYPPGAVEVRAIHVAEGQQVAAGTPLVTVAVTQGRDAGGEGVAGQIREIDRQDGELARQSALAAELGTAETGGLGQQRAGIAAEIASLQRQRTLAAGQAELAESGSARAARLLREQAGTKRQVEDARAAALSRRAEVEALDQQIITQREALRRIGTDIAQRRLGSARSGAELAAQRADLAGRRAALARLDRLDLTAPVAGEISGLNAEIGQRVSPDSSLLTLIPSGSRMEVWLYVTSRAAGRVRIGQEVRLLFDAFPYQKFGSGRGNVVAISATPTDPVLVDPGLKITDPVYRVRVRVDRVAGPRATAGLGQLRPGMTLNADLVLEQRKLWEVFFDPILRAMRR
ncbi:HlyD family secretion protein [Sphingomonas alpina]|uniref:HlyD family efflux transporter periplasmic adaptor subunit n=1 Tax=Sphingomonas alpina TaxID=653931 RepID=A0A7H0LEU1_9SPHN|nr:HlyD family efflux transporter periplasmic adaptor subunit [Sphingomonas alpina]QNQ08194.1 HlyD family efflux transporter periplasmic adaptor subunit [Sphingomonas alpina]